MASVFVFVSLAMALAVPIAVAPVSVALALFITFTHPVFLHEVDRLAACVVATAVFFPIFLMTRRHIQVNRLLMNRYGRLHDDNRLGINDAGLGKGPNVNAPVYPRLVDAYGNANAGLCQCGCEGTSGKR